MAGGLIALLDDVAALAKIAAASLDDVAAGAAKAGSKTLGVIIDDTAVTPQYVKGLSPKRELPIIWRITRGSIRNKIFLFCLPSCSYRFLRRGPCPICSSSADPICVLKEPTKSSND